jgi:hypothetical protein
LPLLLLLLLLLEGCCLMVRMWRHEQTVNIFCAAPGDSCMAGGRLTAAASVFPCHYWTNGHLGCYTLTLGGLLLLLLLLFMHRSQCS